MRYVCKCNNGNPPKKPYNIGMYVCMYVQSRHSGSDYLEKAYQFQTTVYISIYVN